MAAMKLVGSIARKMGFDLTKVRSPTGRVVGARVVRLGFEVSPITSFVVRGQKLSFFVADPADLVQQYHARGQLYEAEELEIIRQHFHGGVFVDIGANVGNHLVYALKVLNASSAIAFEPNPSASVILRVNIALNELGDRTTVYVMGLSSSSGRANIQSQQFHNLGSARLVTGAGDLLIEMGDAVLQGPVSFIKIDTEGMEMAVLAGLQTTITNWQPTLFVEVEDVHFTEFKALLAQHHYKIVDYFRRYSGLANYVAAPVSRCSSLSP